MQLTGLPTTIERLGPEECRSLLATQQVGRLAFLSDGEPDVLPLNYVLDGDAVVFATAPGSKLWGTVHSRVAFEVDDFDPATRSGWSVVIRGLAQEITSLDSTAVLERLAGLSLSPWPGGDHRHIVRLPTGSITGRLVGRRRPALVA